MRHLTRDRMPAAATVVIALLLAAWAAREVDFGGAGAGAFEVRSTALP